MGLDITEEDNMYGYQTHRSFPHPQQPFTRVLLQIIGTFFYLSYPFLRLNSLEPYSSGLETIKYRIPLDRVRMRDVIDERWRLGMIRRCRFSGKDDVDPAGKSV
jgi:hypothetical protein